MTQLEFIKNKRDRNLLLFLRTISVIWATSGIAKLNMEIDPLLIKVLDPVFGLSVIKLLLTAATIEVFLAAICWIPDLRWPAVHVAAGWGLILFAYRINLIVSGAKMHCSCLGNIPRGVGFSEEKTELITLLLLIMIEAIALFFVFSRMKEKNAPVNN